MRVQKKPCDRLPLVGEQIDSANPIPHCIAPACPSLLPAQSTGITSDHAQFVAQPYLPHRMDRVCKMKWRFGESQVHKQRCSKPICRGSLLTLLMAKRSDGRNWITGSKTNRIRRAAAITRDFLHAATSRRRAAAPRPLHQMR